MKKDFNFDDFSALLDQEALFGDIDNSMLSLANRKKFMNEDSEDFMTDEEIEKLGMPTDKSESSIISKKPTQVEEVLEFKRYTKKHIHKYTETEMANIRKECECTIVHDYSENDIYHMSDEERNRYDSLAQLRVKIGSLHKMYSRVDEYINAMRVFIEAWELLEAKDNFIHSKDEFFQLVAEGRIYNSSIIMPRLRKAEKYNQDLLIQYISNSDLDPADLLESRYKEENDNWYDEDPESDEEKFERLMSPEEALFVEEFEDNPPVLHVKDIKRKDIKAYNQKGFSANKKKLSKAKRYKQESLNQMLKQIQNHVTDENSDRYTRSWFITTSVFDTEKKRESVFDKIKFNGSWADKNDVFLYDLALQEAMANEHPNGEYYLTYGDKHLAEFFKTMEEANINVVELRRRMNMTDTDARTTETKSIKKENRKKESALIDRITKLNDNPKFKKMIEKAEKKINNQLSQY